MSIPGVHAAVLTAEENERHSFLILNLPCNTPTNTLL